jgi:hypothetical protein
MSGYLPERVTYVCAKSEKSEIWDDEGEKMIASFTVVPAFPVETGRKLDTAIKWAESDKYKPKCDDLPNDPIKDVEIMGLEARGNGGRAYKVTINGKYYVDMREDVVLETIFDGGILPGGKLVGEYVWGKYGAQMKLIKVGSYTYNEFKKGVNTSNVKELTSSEVKIGSLYKTKSDNLFLYLGPHYTYDLNYERHYCGRSTVDRAHSLTKKKVHLFLKVNEKLYKKGYNGTTLDVLNAEPEEHVLLKHKTWNKGFIDMRDVCLYKSMPKFIQEIGACNIGDYDYVTEIAKHANEYDDNPYMNNWQVDKSCLGKDAPVLRNKVSTLTLPVISEKAWREHEY